MQEPPEAGLEPLEVETALLEGLSMVWEIKEADQRNQVV